MIKLEQIREVVAATQVHYNTIQSKVGTPGFDTAEHHSIAKQVKAELHKAELLYTEAMLLEASRV